VEFTKKQFFFEILRGGEVGISGNQGCRQNATTKPEKLQHQHGEDAAEKEIDIEEDRISEVVARIMPKGISSSLKNLVRSLLLNIRMVILVRPTPLLHEFGMI